MQYNWSFCVTINELVAQFKFTFLILRVRVCLWICVFFIFLVCILIQINVLTVIYDIDFSTFDKSSGGNTLRRSTFAAVCVRRDIYHILSIWAQVSQRVIGYRNYTLDLRPAWWRRVEMYRVSYDWRGVILWSILPCNKDWRTAKNRRCQVYHSRQRYIYAPQHR